MSPEGFPKLPKILRGLSIDDDSDQMSIDDLTPSFSRNKTKTGKSRVFDSDQRSRVYLP